MTRTKLSFERSGASSARPPSPVIKFDVEPAPIAATKTATSPLVTTASLHESCSGRSSLHLGAKPHRGGDSIPRPSRDTAANRLVGARLGPIPFARSEERRVG